MEGDEECLTTSCTQFILSLAISPFSKQNQHIKKHTHKLEQRNIRFVQCVYSRMHVERPHLDREMTKQRAARPYFTEGTIFHYFLALHLLFAYHILLYHV